MDVPGRPGRNGVLAVSSGGDSWAQLLLVTSSFDPAELTLAAPLAPGDTPPPGATFVPIRDFRLLAPGGMWSTAFQLIRLIRRQRFEMIVTTGAAPGLLAIVLGRLAGTQTVWVESLSNARDLSLSGKLAGLFATHWLSQWPHLERPNGPKFVGSVL